MQNPEGVEAKEGSAGETALSPEILPVDPETTSARACDCHCCPKRATTKSSLGYARQHCTKIPTVAVGGPTCLSLGGFKLNSLSKVLFNVPSRCLSTVGLVLVFSLGWRLGLRSRENELSDRRSVARRPQRMILAPHATVAPIKGTPKNARRKKRLPLIHTPHVQKPFTCTGFGAGLLLFHSLRGFWLVSFPPLCDMFKFRGSSRPSGGRRCFLIV